jgi:hypothetical protein
MPPTLAAAMMTMSGRVFRSARKSKTARLVEEVEPTIAGGGEDVGELPPRRLGFGTEEGGADHAAVAGIGRAADEEQVHVDRLRLAEEFQEDFDAFGGWGDRDDGSAHALERAVGDFDFVAGLDDRGDGEQFLILVGAGADFLAE